MDSALRSMALMGPPPQRKRHFCGTHLKGVNGR